MRRNPILTSISLKGYETLRSVLGLFILAAVLNACKDEGPNIDNPYDNQPELEEHDIVGQDTVDIDTFSIQWLQKYIFSPTCANSGCHDGTFEPDFRSTESSYNTLVNRPVIKNDEIDPLPARVVPGDWERSMIIRRLTEDLNNNSGIMPLAIEQDSDWPDRKEEYIAAVRRWIGKGAPDQLGNTADDIDFPPQYHGMAGYVNGNLLPRSNAYYPIIVPNGTTNLELWFAYEDDKTPVTGFMTNDLKYTIDVTKYDSAQTGNLTIVGTPKIFEGYYGEDVEAYHKVVLDVSGYSTNDVIWFRTYVSDGTNEVELPNDNSLFRVRSYTAIVIN